jgi:hypothetical protein
MSLGGMFSAMVGAPSRLLALATGGGIPANLISVSPKITMSGPTAVTMGQSAQYNFNVEVNQGTWNFTVNWGDSGSTNNATTLSGGTVTSLSHTYNKAGSYKIKASVSDAKSENGAYVSYGMITVTNAPKSAGILMTRLSPSSPVAGNVIISSTVITPNITLAIFGLNLPNLSGTISRLSINITPFSIKSGVAFGQVPNSISNARLIVDGKTYGASSMSSSGLVIFDSLKLPLTADTWKDLTLKVDVNATTSSYKVIAVLNGSKSSPTPILGADANYNAIVLPVSGDIKSAQQTFVPPTIPPTTGTLSVGNVSSGEATPILDANNQPISYTWSFSLTLNNNTGSTFYVPSLAGNVLGITTSPVSTTTSIVTVSAGSPNPSDNASAYIIPAGTTRTLSFNSRINKPVSGRVETLTVTSVKYGKTSNGITTAQVTQGLGSLTKTVSF